MPAHRAVGREGQGVDGDDPAGRERRTERAVAVGAQLHLVNRVLEPEQLLEQTLGYARELAVNCSPASMATMKRQVYADLQRELAEALAQADLLMLESSTAPDFREGVTSFIERREPQFAALGA